MRKTGGSRTHGLGLWPGLRKTFAKLCSRRTAAGWWVVPGILVPGVPRGFLGRLLRTRRWRRRRRWRRSRRSRRCGSLPPRPQRREPRPPPQPPQQHLRVPLPAGAVFRCTQALRGAQAAPARDPRPPVRPSSRTACAMMSWRTRQHRPRPGSISSAGCWRPCRGRRAGRTSVACFFNNASRLPVPRGLSKKNATRRVKIMKSVGLP